jgi:predicted phage terminase large subunit-like protein
MTESPTLVAEWPSGAAVQFRHLIHEWTVEDHDGKQYAFVGFDEGQYFSEYQIWYMWGRCRSVCGVRPYLRITCNPDPDCYLRTLLDWWIDPDSGLPIADRDGVIRWAIRFNDDLEWFDTESEAWARVGELRAANPEDEAIGHIAPISIQFIRSRLSDNKELLAADPGYGARLAMQDADSRRKKLEGNWNSRIQAGEMFNRAWFGIIDSLPPWSQVALAARGWDKAASKPTKKNPDPDWTRGVELWRLKNGHVIIADMVSLRGPPGEVDDLVKCTAEADGHRVTQCFWLDPAQAGLVDEAHTRALLKELPCSVEFEVCNKTNAKVEFAKPWSAYADPHSGPVKFFLLRAPWNKEFLAEIEKFPKPKGPDGKEVHDDIVDATSRAWLHVDKIKISPNVAELLKRAMQRG